MFGAAEADALGAEGKGCCGLVGGVGIGAHSQSGGLGAPVHDALEVAVGLALLRLHGLADEYLDDFGGGGGQFTGVDEAGGAVQREVVAFLVGLAGDFDGAVVVVDGHFAHAADADLAHLAGNEGGVAGETTAGGEDALCRNHAAQVFRAGFQTHQQHLFSAVRGFHAAGGVQVDAAGGGAGAGVESLGNRLHLAHGGIVEDGGEHLVHLVGGNAAHGGLPVDEAFLFHVAGDAEGGDAGALAVAGLEHVDLAVLDGELEVLHVAEVVFEGLADGAEFLVGAGHDLGQAGDGVGGADTGHHVFALGVHEEFAVEFVGAGGGVAGEGHTGAGFIAGVAEYHALHVHGGAPFAGDAVFLAVGDGAFVVPGAEHGADGALQLVPGAGGEHFAGALEHEGLEAADEFLVVLGGEFGVGDVLAVALVLQGMNHAFEGFHILVFGLLHTHDHVAVHLHEAAVAVPGKAGVAGGLGHGGHGLIVQAEVQDGIHHAGHGFAGAGAHGDEQGHFHGVAELAADVGLHLRDTFFHAGIEFCRVGAAVVVVVGADLSGDGEPGRHGQADACHFCQVGALATQQGLHAAVAIGGSAAEMIDYLVHIH